MTLESYLFSYLSYSVCTRRAHQGPTSFHRQALPYTEYYTSAMRTEVRLAAIVSGFLEFVLKRVKTKLNLTTFWRSVKWGALFNPWGVICTQRLRPRGAIHFDAEMIIRSIADRELLEANRTRWISSLLNNFLGPSLAAFVGCPCAIDSRWCSIETSLIEPRSPCSKNRLMRQVELSFVQYWQAMKYMLFHAFPIYICMILSTWFVINSALFCDSALQHGPTFQKNFVASYTIKGLPSRTSAWKVSFSRNVATKLPSLRTVF